MKPPLIPAFARSISIASVFRAVLLCLSTLHLTASPALAGDRVPLEKLSEGAPTYLGRRLPAEAYAKFETYRLKNAKVMWLNFDWLSGHGYEFPDNGLVPDFEKRILDTFAYMVPPSNASAEAKAADFNLQASKSFYADRYGGLGIGVNFGSGRAGSAGKIQIKGIGQTPLVGPGQTFDHAHGGASLEEAIREAIWGEINHHELPNGSNRVIAIIDTGTYTHWTDGGKERRALIIREDPLRPAHLIAVWTSQTEADKARMNAIDPLKFLPGTGDVAERYRQYVQRAGQALGSAAGRRFYHGGSSPSNIEVSGKFLDFGTETAHPSFDPIKILNHAPSSTEVEVTGRNLIEELCENLQLDCGPAVELFKASFEKEMKHQLMLAAGFPEELIRSLSEHPTAKALMERLRKMTRSSRAAANVDKEMLAPPSSGDLTRILIMASDTSPLNFENLNQKLSAQLPDEVARGRFIHDYLDFYRVAFEKAAQDGVTGPALHHFVKLQARRLNSPTPDLYRSKMRSENVQLIERYLEDGNRSKIWDSIDARIQKGRRVPRHLAPYQVIISERPELLRGRYHLTVYDAKANTEREITILTRDCNPLFQP